MRYLAVILALLPTYALADTHCGDTLEVRRDAREMGESRISMGMSDLAQLELWANLQTETWRILITYPNGETCVAITGTDYLEGA